MKLFKKKQINEEAEEGSEALTKFELFLRKINKKVVIIALLLIFNVGSSSPGAKGTDMESTVNVPTLSVEQLYVNSVKEKFSIQLVSEVEKYILDKAPNCKLSPDYLVEKCIEYDTDIVFVLAQALLESHFGTKGKAAVTNSIWNVGTYDDGQILYTYETPDESLEPYLKLINEKYLINITPRGDTIYKDLGHLVQDRGYINYNGNRFASAKGYENSLRKLMIMIDMETSIKFYQEIVTLSPPEILAYFGPLQVQKTNEDKLLAQNTNKWQQ